MVDKAEDEVSDHILTLPNLLSFLRLALVPVFLVLLVEGHDLEALVILAISGITDFLDGYLARKLNQVSKLGKLLDPAADRLYILAALLGLAWREMIPWWLVVAILGRDVMLVGLGAVLARLKHPPLPVNWVGKWATACLFIGFPLLMLAAYLEKTPGVLHMIGLGIALIGAALYWWAGILYLIATVKISRQNRSDSEVGGSHEGPQSDRLNN
ncbi:CDP-diacylglycerol--glycerol-3-phosphate 3-phosphatidyltransferase [Mycetocola spongiae]|uniref:CDP-diacylglycerol--glycerol-3-phosphate 3-phosphatidyltransferase n=1 Tax=Mycetocola spongiae TaxID=2859226 RepID=UPI001CF4722A|nr:CDP-diacylglycerol--glycerol-3-phosphate 3-phosphatidyltransferase [Mycetocola spongiae]UCR89814.1 CDP-diacylglycerol--glycerol-3-phosphate 3-phosphatidyltransferase [Mycetocola spongiae]